MTCALRISPDVHLGDAQVPVRVVLDVVQSPEIAGLDVEHDALGDDGNPIAAAVAQALDGTAPASVSTIAAADRVLELLEIKRHRRTAALPIPSARCPALRPIVIHEVHRDVVVASTIRFFTISTPWWRAVWKPNVSR